VAEAKGYVLKTGQSSAEAASTYRQKRKRPYATPFLILKSSGKFAAEVEHEAMASGNY
jgi:hypothetical protein